jgi:hypothetical protein
MLSCAYDERSDEVISTKKFFMGLPRCARNDNFIFNIILFPIPLIKMLLNPKYQISLHELQRRLVFPVPP